jgi:hypothetical protein
VTENWAAVATTIQQRMTEIGMQQQELIKRSRVSKTIVTEIQHNNVRRRRSARTLEALSVALAWHPHHLDAVLEGRKPPQIGSPVAIPAHDVPSRLAAIDSRLQEIIERIDASRDRLDQLCADLSAAMRRNGRRKT